MLETGRLCFSEIAMISSSSASVVPNVKECPALFVTSTLTFDPVEAGGFRVRKRFFEVRVGFYQTMRCIPVFIRCFHPFIGQNISKFRTYRGNLCRPLDIRDPDDVYCT